jgi:hypothetical protein
MIGADFQRSHSPTDDLLVALQTHRLFLWPIGGIFNVLMANLRKDQDQKGGDCKPPSLVKGTTLRCLMPSQRRQCEDLTFRMLAPPYQHTPRIAAPK